MCWFLRLFVWATLLAPLCWFLALPYQRWLAGTITSLVNALGVPIRITGLGLSTPFEVGFFIALCLASARAPMAVRLRAVLFGTPALIAAEVLILGTAFLLEVRAAAGLASAVALRGVAMDLRGALVWALAIGLWLVLLGRRELPEGERPAPVPRTLTPPLAPPPRPGR